MCVCVCMLGAVPGGQKALCLATVTFDSHISSEIYLYLYVKSQTLLCL